MSVCPFMSTPDETVDCKENCKLNSEGICCFESMECNTSESKIALKKKLDTIIDGVNLIKRAIN